MSKFDFHGPVVLAILDGVGLRSETTGNAVLAAHTEFLDRVMRDYPMLALEASGEAVGLAKGQMGNSEVGHNVIGCGQIIKQGVAKIEDDFSTGRIWESAAWRGAIENIKRTNGVLHFSGIFSDGGVHSDIKHLKLMLERAAKEGVEKVRTHLVLDGRDVPPQSAEKYIKDLEDFIKTLGPKPGKTFTPDSTEPEITKPLDYRIASGGGRMIFVADRYETDWNIVKYGYDAIVHGEADYYCSSALDAISHYRKENPTLQDQYMPDFVITEPTADPTVNLPIGKVKDGDSFIYIDFRADRALEIAQAFTYEDFPYFDRRTKNPDGSVSNRRLNVFFAGMTEYNSDTHVPEHQLIEPVKFDRTLHDFLGNNHVTQLAISESAKFGHITYYFNGNSYDAAPGENSIKIESSTLPYDERPWMRAAEITDAALAELENYDFVRINYPNGDMVGHFGDFEATVTAMEAVDIQLKRLAKKVDELQGLLIITADHGNAEDLIDEAGGPKTAHSTSPVPCIFYDNTENRRKYILKALPHAGLANLAATISEFLGLENIPKLWNESLILQK